MLPIEVLVHAIESSATPKEAGELIQKFEVIRHRVAERKRKCDEILKQSYEQVKKMMAEEICRHEVCIGTPDASGGRDSDVKCLICGEWLENRQANGL